jgi:hypothetical protein
MATFAACSIECAKAWKLAAWFCRAAIKDDRKGEPVPCLMVLLALCIPRVVIVLLWLFTYWFNGIFPNPLWPVLGFVFLPTTLLWYTAVQHWFAGQWTLIPIIGIIIALLIDLSPASGRRRRVL